MFRTRCLYHTSFKCKLATGFVVIIIYILVYNGFLNVHFRIPYNNGINLNRHHHEIGKIIANNNGSFLYFHLPSLNDYSIENDYFQLNSLNIDNGPKGNHSQFKRFCLRKGSEIIDVNLNDLYFCICKKNYFGNDCAVPEMIHQVIGSNTKIIRLKKPRRILLSLIWVTHDFDNNAIGNISRLDQFVKTLDSLANLTDFFVIHEIVLKSKNNFTIDHNLLNYQFNNGALRRFKPFSLLNTQTIQYSELNQLTLNLNKLELDLSRQSWKIFTNRVTEYRPNDLLIFLSINNFPKEELLLFLKHYTVLSDFIHLKPTNLWSLKSGQFLTTSIIDDNRFSNKSTTSEEFDSRSKMAQDTKKNKYLSEPIRNTVVTFEYISFLCRYNFDQFLSNYCSAGKEMIKHFELNFWPTQPFDIGNSNFPSVLTI